MASDDGSTNSKEKALLEVEDCKHTEETFLEEGVDGKCSFRETFNEQMLNAEHAWKTYATRQNRAFSILLIVACGFAALIGRAAHGRYKETHPELFGGYIVKDRSDYLQNSYIDNNEYSPNPCGDRTCRFSRDILVDAFTGWNNGCGSVQCREMKQDGEIYYQALDFGHDCEGCHFNGRVYGIGDKVDYEPDACGNTCYCRPHQDNTKYNLLDSTAAVYCSAKPCNQCRFGNQVIKGGSSVMADACTKCSCPIGGGKAKCAKLCNNEDATQGCLFEGFWYEYSTCFAHPYNRKHMCGCFNDGTVACTADNP